MKLVIIGGGAGGGSCAARARRLDDTAEIIILEKSDEISIANCGLPYYCGDIITDRDNLTSYDVESFKEMLNIDVKLNTEVTAIDSKKQEVTTNKGEKISYDKLVLALGVQPIIPDIDGLDKMPHFTLRRLSDADEIKMFIKQHKPKTAAVIGAGYIGVEIAENINLLGIKTCIVEKQTQILKTFDEDMIKPVQNHLKEIGINLYFSEAITALDKNNIILESGKKIKADFVIFAVGIKAETSIAKTAGIELGINNCIRVNEFMQTNLPNIYACGDSVAVKDFVTKQETMIALAGPANRQGRLIANHIFDKPYPYTGTQGTAIIKVGEMTVACCGNTEKQLKAQKLDYQASVIKSYSHSGYYPDAKEMTIKLLYNGTGNILGAQIVGSDGVDKRMDVIATTMRLGGKVADLRDAELCYAPPYGSAKDPINQIGMVAQNAIEGLVKPFTGDDISGFYIIDVRMPSSFKKQHLDGAVNIPLAKLKSKLAEIPKDKPILVYCFRGWTSYLASRVLLQNGFNDVYSLSGGIGYFLSKQ